MESLKIGVDIRELQKDIMTGMGRYLLNFLETIPKYKPEWEFVLFCNQNTTARVTNDNLKKVVIKESLTFYWDQIKLPLALRKEKIDLFLSPYNKAPIISPCKVIITIHDLAPFLSFFPQAPINHLYIKLQKGLNNLMAKRADLIITVSNNSKKDIICLFNVAEQKIRVVYNGVGERFYPIKDKIILNNIRKRYDIAEDYILYIGNLKPHKNVSGLINAYNILPEDLKKKYQLVVVGKKDENFSCLFNLCKSLMILSNVIFIDFVDDKDLPSLYSAATIFVFPSFYEGFGLPVLEAMACGVPVVTSCIASLPEVSGDATSLVNPCDTKDIARTIEKLLVDSSLRENLAIRGFAQSRNFPVDKMVKNVICAIEELF